MKLWTPTLYLGLYDTECELTQAFFAVVTSNELTDSEGVVSGDLDMANHISHWSLQATVLV